MNVICIDPKNLDSMIEIMDMYGDTATMLFGEDENGEDTFTSICKDHIEILTCYDNGWIRKNVYWRNGTREESYER